MKSLRRLIEILCHHNWSAEVLVDPKPATKKNEDLDTIYRRSLPVKEVTHFYNQNHNLVVILRLEGKQR